MPRIVTLAVLLSALALFGYTVGVNHYQEARYCRAPCSQHAR
jgi:hypothetical protein